MQFERLEDFFTESNAYWMAIYTEHYRSIVTKVTKKGIYLPWRTGISSQTSLLRVTVYTGGSI